MDRPVHFSQRPTQKTIAAMTKRSQEVSTDLQCWPPGQRTFVPWHIVPMRSACQHIVCPSSVDGCMLSFHQLLPAELAAAKACCSEMPCPCYTTAWTSMFLHWPCTAHPLLARSTTLVKLQKLDTVATTNRAAAHGGATISSEGWGKLLPLILGSLPQQGERAHISFFQEFVSIVFQF